MTDYGAMTDDQFEALIQKAKLGGDTEPEDADTFSDGVTDPDGLDLFDDLEADDPYNPTHDPEVTQWRQAAHDGMTEVRAAKAAKAAALARASGGGQDEQDAQEAQERSDQLEDMDDETWDRMNAALRQGDPQTARRIVIKAGFPSLAGLIS